MIQELFGGGAGLVGGERGIYNGSGLEGSPSSSPSPSSTTNTTTPTTTTTSSSLDHQNLRCPRCDSPNTKFCYYNNYNLTQPRHFCKTCRRYWTKGGALRNVPIGGGCRKNKNISVAAAVGKSSSGKIKTTSDIIKSNLGSGFDHEPSSNPILWASPHNSQLLSLLRATQNPNPNFNPITNSAAIKEEVDMIESHMTSESAAAATGSLNARTLSLACRSQDPIGLCNSFWRSNHHQSQQYQQQQQQQQQQGLLQGEVQNTGIQELYQRLRSSVNYYTDHSPAVPSNVASASSSFSSMLESAPVTAGESGYWNPVFSWSDLPTINGAFP